jgi:hypothetical protein
MSDLKPSGPKTNHKKGIAAAKKALKREQAEARNAAYQQKKQQLEAKEAK